MLVDHAVIPPMDLQTGTDVYRINEVSASGPVAAGTAHRSRQPSFWARLCGRGTPGEAQDAHRLQMVEADNPRSQTRPEGGAPERERRNLQDKITELEARLQQVQEERAQDQRGGSRFSLSQAASALQKAASQRVALTPLPNGKEVLQSVCWRNPSLKLRSFIKIWLRNNNALNTKGSCEWRNTASLHSYVVLFIETKYDLQAAVQESGLESENICLRPLPELEAGTLPLKKTVAFPKKSIQTNISEATDRSE
mmetsp:Transcript_39152/g.76999  ORF Transcript_39152/g.76999 Transcript_39152/m.76999 type:complete len:253 (+) Transcript_39152:684-1442(+)